MVLGEGIKLIKDILFPIKCIACGQEGEWLCRGCQINLELNLKDINFDKAVNGLNRLTALFNFKENDLVFNLIYHLKYFYCLEVADVLCDYFQNINFENNYLIVPVPLHNRRKRERGFNQSEVIADKIIKQAQKQNINLQKDFKNFKRVRYTKQQAKLTKKERKYNLTEAFIWIGGDLTDQRIILVDDVYTSGSTMKECALVLRQNGAKCIWGMVLAKG